MSMKILIFDDSERGEKLNELAKNNKVESVKKSNFPKDLTSYDILLCHISDLSEDNCIQLGAFSDIIIIYSGEAVQKSVNDTTITLKITNKEIKIKSETLENICAVNRPIDPIGITSDSDLNLIPALEYYVNNPNDVQGFFNKILNYDPVLEAKLDFLHKCLNEKPTELPKKIANEQTLIETFQNLSNFGSENYEQILQVFANKLLDQ